MSEDRPRLISFTPEGFTAFLNVLHKTYGSAGDAMVYTMSEEYGKTMIHWYLPDLPDDLHARSAALEKFGAMSAQMGWGKMVLKEIDVESGSIKVVMEDMPFSPCKGSEGNPACILSRGTTAGLLEAALNLRLSVKNLDCGARSMDCRIEYEIS